MKLQTKIPLKKQSNNLIDYNSSILLIGSCFSENIGDKFEYFKFQHVTNPFGILFHPKAIETLISNAINEKQYSEKDVFFHNEKWHCFDAHSKLSNTSKENLINQLNKQVELTTKQLNNTTHIVITLGTAWVYNHLKTDNTVANCHKVAQKEFEKELMSVGAIYKSLKSIAELIKNANTETSITFTVSPVRHLKDGFTENTQSKAHLIAAVHQTINMDNNIYYFPSYEIMMDELRDYRFYNDDMLHPNQTAINYIWEKFQNVWISSDTLKTMGDIESIQKGMQHKPFNPNSKAHQKFIQNLEAKIKELQSKFPKIKF